MDTAIPFYMTIIMIWINNYAVTPPRGPFEIFPVLPKGVAHDPEEKLSIFGTPESDHKFGHGNSHTVFYNPKKESDQ